MNCYSIVMLCHAFAALCPTYILVDWNMTMKTALENISVYRWHCCSNPSDGGPPFFKSEGTQSIFQ